MILMVQGSVGKRKRERCYSCDSLHDSLVSSGSEAGVRGVSCGQQARLYSDVTVEDLAGNNMTTSQPDLTRAFSGYLDDTAFFPKRMSYMAEMMYT